MSGIIIGVTAYLESSSLRAALVTALVSVVLKTPFYSVHEVVFDLIWHRKAKPAPATEDQPPLRIAA